MVREDGRTYFINGVPVAKAQDREPPRRAAGAWTDGTCPGRLLFSSRPIIPTGSTAAMPRLAGSAKTGFWASGGRSYEVGRRSPRLYGVLLARHRPRLRPARCGLGHRRARPAGANPRPPDPASKRPARPRSSTRSSSAGRSPGSIGPSPSRGWQPRRSRAAGASIRPSLSSVTLPTTKAGSSLPPARGSIRSIPFRCAPRWSSLMEMNPDRLPGPCAATERAERNLSS